jgi:hypothetical protein
MPFNTLSPKGESLVVLDTNVLIPPRTSDVLMDLRLTEVCRVYWTLEIEALTGLASSSTMWSW